MDFKESKSDSVMEMSRELIAEQIIAEADNYQICEGCFSIISRELTMCSNCHSYQFDTDIINIKRQAQILAKRKPNSVTAQDLL